MGGCGRPPPPGRRRSGSGATPRAGARDRWHPPRGSRARWRTRRLPPPGVATASSGTHNSITNRPPGPRWWAALWKQATCSCWVSRFEMVLNTRYTRVNPPGARAVAMSPITTGMVASSALVRSCSTIGGDSSMPVTGTSAAGQGYGHPARPDGELQHPAPRLPARPAGPPSGSAPRGRTSRRPACRSGGRRARSQISC